MIDIKAVYILATRKFIFEKNKFKDYKYHPLLVGDSYEMKKYPSRYLLENDIEDKKGSTVLCVYEVDNDEEMNVVKQDLIHLSDPEYAPKLE